MYITGTHFNYYLICKRKLWFFSNGIHMEQTSDAVYEGKLIHENSYLNRSDRFKEIAIGGIKIDYFDSKKNIVHEIKKSDSREEAHIWQLKYYLYVLEQYDVIATGLLEYPKLKKTEEIFLTPPDKEYIEKAKLDIEKILRQKETPEKIPISKCKNCSYYDLCYSGEE